MAKMKVIAPKMKALQEQYANDKQQLQVKMMEMYKQEKINPLGGCLPILVQIPVFIALYWVLLSAVELRHAPWICWIKDLSAPDPYFVLPVIYAITAYLQVQAVADADLRSGAGEGDADHADRVLGDVHLLPVGPRALLARQQLAADLPAVAHEPRAREGSGGSPRRSGANGDRDAAARRGASAAIATRHDRAAAPTRSRRSPRRPGAAASASFACRAPAFAAMIAGIVGARARAARRDASPRFAARDGEALDQGLALYFPAPRSYTGEAVLELHGHGGPAVLRLLLARCVELGARLARAGRIHAARVPERQARPRAGRERRRSDRRRDGDRGARGGAQPVRRVLAARSARWSTR